MNKSELFLALTEEDFSVVGTVVFRDDRYNFSAPTIDMAIEKLGAIERKIENILSSEQEDDGENAKPLTPRELKNAKETQDSDDFDQSNHHAR